MIVAEPRFAQQTKIAKLLMSQILTDKSDCELKVQRKCYVFRRAWRARVAQAAPRAVARMDGCARNTSDRAETSVATGADGSVARQLTGMVDPMCACALLRLCAWG